LLIVAGLTLAVMAPGPVAADHGSWNHHHLHWWEEGSSQYGSYADVDATDAYDYGHAWWDRYTTGWSHIEGEEVGCSGAEACNYRKTVTQYFPQSSYYITSQACANDGAHELSGTTTNLTCMIQGLLVHYHSARTN
jgi:hypothetical protein